MEGMELVGWHVLGLQAGWGSLGAQRGSGC